MLHKKEKAFEGEKEFRDIDELKVPNIKFFVEKSFDELAGKRIMGTNLVPPKKETPEEPVKRRRPGWVDYFLKKEDK